MTNRYKIVFLMFLAAAILAVIFLPGSDYFASPEDPGTETGQDPFAPTEEPFRAFVEARRAGTPIVLEFYARW